ncbi:UdgX family uracil-DNA binding protein [Alsobacter sp. SYSU M60028]|uniref:Type-4 uracil-DNA glycosylase n=1 Tax=Alsobacter ponti TaxID=2962936 RepID=A0ABT1L903_9HYPH|nr:UdgX family uracil-DNA binding protein [Alsobacter ponti]MCP8937964.1 UdgX family uracil-DNA binding protein [Alsobacter ponti]
MREAEPATLTGLYESMAGLEPNGPGVGRFVPGEGRERAPLLFVGEQPGDREDVEGRPFVGPAGQALDRALAEAGVARDDAFVTNAVKRFHFAERGKKRLHRRPTAGEISRERWWLQQEIALVGPRLVVALGAVALQALAGRALTIAASRGPTRWPDGRAGFVTVHPSSLLRQPDAEARRRDTARFVADLREAARLAGVV